MNDQVAYNYIKPFNLFHYNKPKQPALRTRRGPIDYKAQPKVPVRPTNAMKMRNKVIKKYMEQEADPYINFKELALESGKLITKDPEIIPRDTRASQFRYKWVREIPVVSCRFTEHVIMYKKPPFSYEKPCGCCGQYRLRNMEIKDPEPEPEIVEEVHEENIPSILL